MDRTTIPNLSPNASPLTPICVEMLERAMPGGFNFLVCRLRDSWLRFANPTPGTPTCSLFVNIGGDLRGGANAPLWFRLRSHPWYLGDGDACLIQEHAEVQFAIRDEAVACVAEALARNVPAACVSADRKQQDSVDRAMGRPVEPYASSVSPDEVQLLCGRFVAAVVQMKRA